jgi:excisionase family DNA binding protein
VSLLVLELDDALRGHLALAVRMHRVQLRRNGRPVPRGLVALEAAFCVPVRQGATEVADPVQPQDAGGMALAITLDKTARTLGVSRRSVERMIAAGVLPAVSIGGIRRVRVRDLEKYVDSLRPSAGDGARPLDGSRLESAPPPSGTSSTPGGGGARAVERDGS